MYVFKLYANFDKWGSGLTERNVCVVKLFFFSFNIIHLACIFERRMI
jgi:hypothetical protein